MNNNFEKQTQPEQAQQKQKQQKTQKKQLTITDDGQARKRTTIDSETKKPGAVTAQATSEDRPKLIGSGKAARPEGGCSKNCGEVPLNFNPSTSKAAQALSVIGTDKTPASGAAKLGMTKSPNKAASHVSIVQGGMAMTTSYPKVAPPPAKLGDRRKSPWHKNPTKRASNTRRAALRFIDILGSKKAEDLTNEQKASLAWAKAHIAELPSATPPVPGKVTMPKRQRSEEEAAAVKQQPGTKRPKISSKPMNKSFSEVAKGHLVRAIIDRSVDNGAISHTKWDLVKQKLMGVFWTILRENPGPPPQCDDAGWYQGHVKLMACADERSALLLKRAIELLGEVWEGARLDVVLVGEIPRRPRSIATIPAEPSEPEEILRIIQCCNPQLPTQDWKVVKVSAAEGSSRTAIVVINQQSLEPLRERQGKLYYGFSTILLRVYRSDNKGNPAPSVSEAKQPEESMACDDAVGSSDKEDTQSVSGLVGDFFDHLGDMVDEDVLLESDQEDVNITVVAKMDHGEGATDKPPPL